MCRGRGICRVMETRPKEFKNSERRTRVPFTPEEDSFIRIYTQSKINSYFLFRCTQLKETNFSFITPPKQETQEKLHVLEKVLVQPFQSQLTYRKLQHEHFRTTHTLQGFVT